MFEIVYASRIPPRPIGGLEALRIMWHKLVEYGRQVKEGVLGGSWKCLGVSQRILGCSLGTLGGVLG